MFGGEKYHKLYSWVFWIYLTLLPADVDSEGDEHMIQVEWKKGKSYFTDVD